MLKQITCGVIAFGLACFAANDLRAGPVDVSYTVSGVSGSYDLDFSVTNNMLASPTQNVYFFGVQLSVTNITGSPDPFFDTHLPWNFGIYDNLSHPELN